MIGNPGIAAMKNVECLDKTADIDIVDFIMQRDEKV